MKPEEIHDAVFRARSGKQCPWGQVAVAERSDGGGGEMPGSLLKQDSRELRQSEGNIGCHRSKREGVGSRASRGVGRSPLSWVCWHSMTNRALNIPILGFSGITTVQMRIWIRYLPSSAATECFRARG